MNDKFEIVVGSKFSVDSGGDEPTVGVFMGLSMIGNGDAMVFQLEDGTLRFVSCAQIISMDLLEAAPDDGTRNKRAEPGSVYYG